MWFVCWWLFCLGHLGKCAGPATGTSVLFNEVGLRKIAWMVCVWGCVSPAIGTFVLFNEADLSHIPMWCLTCPGCWEPWVWVLVKHVCPVCSSSEIAHSVNNTQRITTRAHSGNTCSNARHMSLWRWRNHRRKAWADRKNVLQSGHCALWLAPSIQPHRPCCMQCKPTPFEPSCSKWRWFLRSYFTNLTIARYSFLLSVYA